MFQQQNRRFEMKSRVEKLASYIDNTYGMGQATIYEHDVSIHKAMHSKPPATGIYGGFMWSDTREGLNFWSRVYASLMENPMVLETRFVQKLWGVGTFHEYTRLVEYRYKEFHRLPWWVVKMLTIRKYELLLEAGDLSRKDQHDLYAGTYGFCLRSGLNCGTCPIGKAGHRGCHDTPWERLVIEDTITDKSIKAEINFLKGVKV